MPSILSASSAASSADLAIFTPPPLPRPPAWICALTTTPVAPSWNSARGRSVGFFGALDHLSARHGHSVLRQDGFALVLVNFHIGMTDADAWTRCSGPAGRDRIVCSL